MKCMTRGTAAALLIVALMGSGSASAAPVNVTVRVEGPTETLLPETKVTVDGSGVPGLGCPNTAAEALEKATNGNWQRASFFDTVLGETLVYNPTGAFWSQWHNGAYGGGICKDVVTDGGEVLIIADVSSPTYGPTVFPAYLTGVPAAGIRLGESATVRVEEVTSDGNTGNGAKQPLAGATVTAGPVTATTDATGTATLTPTSEGTFAVRAVKGVQRTPVRMLAVGPAAQAAAAASVAAAACRTSGTDGRCGTRDRQSPWASISGLTNGQAFGKGKGPRTLSGVVGVVGAPGDTAASGLQADPSGLQVVKLRIARRDGGRCSSFSGRKERFVASKCGAQNAKWFRIEAGATWSYLLPSALPRGRYVIDVNAVDKAYNRDDARIPGRNRMVITVG